MTKFNLCFSLVTSLFFHGLSPFAQAQSPTKTSNGSGAFCDLSQDRCHQKQLTPEQRAKSGFLTDEVNATLEFLYEQYKEKGQDLKTVIISRAGTSLENFAIMKERDGSETLSEMISRLITETASAPASVYDANPNTSVGISNQVLKSNINSKETLRYSHAGIAIRNLDAYNSKGEKIRGPGTGKWSISHLLYSCKNSEADPNSPEYLRASQIHGKGVLPFFLDDLAEYRAQIIIPTPEIQANLERILTDKDHEKNLQLDSFRFIKHYNALARYTDLRQENSNQFVLEAVASSISPSDELNRSRQANIDTLTRTGYSPTKLTPTGLASLLNSTLIQGWISNVMPTVCFKDQPEIGKYGLGEVVTTNSILNWMTKNSLVLDVIETSLSQADLDILKNATFTNETKR